MEKNKRKIGACYEQIAGEFLKKLGYEILEYNFHSLVGEIDIVALYEEYLVFIEVKYRKDAKKGNPFEAISMQKQKRISKCALYYIKKHELQNMPVRFDVVGILGKEIQVISNAFDFLT